MPPLLDPDWEFPKLRASFEFEVGQVANGRSIAR